MIVVGLAVVDDVQPKVVAVLIHIAAEIAEVLHQHKSRVVLAHRLEFAVTRIVGIWNVLEIRNLDHVAQNERAAAAGVHRENFLLPLRVVDRSSQTSGIKQLVDHLCVAHRDWISRAKCGMLHPLIGESLFVRFQIRAADDAAAV